MTAAQRAFFRAAPGYGELFRALIERDLRVRYRRSALGIAWTMLQPLLMMAVLTLVFSGIFRSSIENYPAYALPGLLFWNFFSQSVGASMRSLQANASLLTKLPVSPFVFPVAAVLAGVVNLVLALVPMLAILAAMGHPWSLSLLALPGAVLIATVFTVGTGLMLAPLAAFFSDTVEIVGVLLTALMYATPIIYPASIVPAEYAWLVAWNPLRPILEALRTPVYLGQWPTLGTWLVASSLAVLCLIVGIVTFRRHSWRVAYHV